MSKKPLVFFWVESRFSNTHADWVMKLAETLHKKGIDSCIATSTGNRIKRPISDGISILELPGFESEYGERKDITVYGKPSLEDTEWRAARKQLIAHKLRELNPAAIITESWPLGKNQPYEQELNAILQFQDKTKTPLYGLSMELPLYTRFPICEPAGGNLQNTKQIIDGQFKKIFVTSDGRLSRVENVLPELADVKQKFAYPGYFVDQDRFDETLAPRCSIIKNKTVLVACGSGFKEEDIEFLKKVISAKQASSLKDYNWEVFISAECPDELYNQFQKDYAQQGLTIQRNSQKFMDALPYADILISRPGQTTTLLALSLGANCLFIPRPSSTEHKTRARILSEKGLANVVDQSRPVNELSAKLDSLSDEKSKTEYAVGCDGHIECARMIEKEIGYGSGRFSKQPRFIAR